MSNEFSFQNSDGSFLTTEPIQSVTVSTLTVGKRHLNKTNRLDVAAGTTLTLPRAVGSGERFRFVIGTALTSNSNKIQVANSSDYMRGQARLVCSANAGFATANTGTVATESDTITLNGTTTGGVVGDVIDIQDIAKNVWAVQVDAAGSSTAATPFSVAV